MKTGVSTCVPTLPGVQIWRVLTRIARQRTPAGTKTGDKRRLGRKWRILSACMALTASLYGQSPDSLGHYLFEAARNSPSVQATFHAYEAALQQIPRMGALEDPRVDIGFFLQPMELVEGRDLARFQVMQMFPWFGVRKAARTEAHHMAQMAYEQFRESRDNLWQEARMQWYALCVLQQRLTNNVEHLRRLEILERLLLQRFAAGGGGGNRTPAQGMDASATASALPSGGMTGMNMGGSVPTTPSSDRAAQTGGNMAGMTGGATGSMSDVLRVRLELAETENTGESLRSEIRESTARFNLLLNRPALTPMLLPDTLTQDAFLLDVPTAMQAVATQNPMLGMWREESLAWLAREEMERKMSYPMIGVGIQYMWIGRTSVSAPAAGGTDNMNGMETSAPSPMNAMNGRDMVMPMISFTLPVYRSKYTAAQRESRLRRKSAQARHDDALNRLEAELHLLRHRLDDATRTIVLSRRQSALAQTAYELAVQELAAGKTELDVVLQLQRQLLDYRLRETEAVATYNTQAAAARKIISITEEQEQK